MRWLRRILEEILKRVARLTYHHPRLITVLLAVAAIALGTISAFRLGVVNSTNDLINQDSPALKSFLDYQREFQTNDSMVIVVESAHFQRNTEAIEALAQRVNTHAEDFQAIYFKNDFSLLKPHLLLFKEQGELQAILEQIRSQKDLLKSAPKGVNLNSLLSDGIRMFKDVEQKQGKGGSLDQLGLFAEGMVKQLETLSKDLQAPLPTPGTAGVQEVDEGPEEEMERELAQHTYLSFDDGQLLLMDLIPVKGDKGSFSPYDKTIEVLRQDIQLVRKDFPDVKISLTGEPVLLSDELNLSTRDMMISSIVAFILIAVLFFWAYHEFIRPLLALTALVCSVAATYGFTALVLGHLNIISQAFVLMLLGLGVDLGIQLIGRYEEERTKGASVLTALENTLQFTGVPIIISAGTTALAFYTMCFNDFIGLAELGIIAGTGMVLAMFYTLVMLPALITWREQVREIPLPKDVRKQSETGNKIDAILLSRPWLVLGVAAVFTIIMGIFAFRVQFDYNLLNLQNKNMESVAMAQKLSNPKVFNLLYGVIIADNLDDARVKVAALQKMPEVQSVVCPPVEMLPADQNERLAIMATLKKELDSLKLNLDVKSEVDVENARKNLKFLLDSSVEGRDQAAKYLQATDKRAKMAHQIFSRLIPALENTLKSLQGMSQQEAAQRLKHFQVRVLGNMERQFQFLRTFDMQNPIKLEEMPEPLRRRYISPSGKILIEVNSTSNVWEREANETFVKALRTISPQATGTPVQNYVYIDLLRHSYAEAAVMAFIGIVLAVGLYFLSPLRLILSILPLILGVIWMLGTMAIFGVEFNPANVITLPLVVGIGVAYGVYLIDRHMLEGRTRLFSSSTGKAVFLSALTTIFGFAAMMIGHYPGLVSLGFVMSMAIAYCLIAGMIVLPQILILLDRRKQSSSKPQ